MSLKIHLPCSKVMAEWNIRYTIHLLSFAVYWHCIAPSTISMLYCTPTEKVPTPRCQQKSLQIDAAAMLIWSPREFRWSQGGWYNCPGTRATAHHRRKERISSGGAWSGAKYLRQTSEAVVNSARSWQTRSPGRSQLGILGWSGSQWIYRFFLTRMGIDAFSWPNVC